MIIAAFWAVFFVARGGDQCGLHCPVFGLGLVLGVEVVELVVDGSLMVGRQDAVLAQEILDDLQSALQQAPAEVLQGLPAKFGWLVAGSQHALLATVPADVRLLCLPAEHGAPTPHRWWVQPEGVDQALAALAGFSHPRADFLRAVALYILDRTH